MLEFFFPGVTAPGGSGSPHYLGITIADTPHPVGIHWTSDQPDAESRT